MGVAFRDSIIFGVHVLAQSIANIVVVDFFHARLHLSEFRHYIRTFVTFCPFHRYYQFIGALAFNERKIPPLTLGALISDKSANLRSVIFSQAGSIFVVLVVRNRERCHHCHCHDCH